jgi:hypothetical protein
MIDAYRTTICDVIATTARIESHDANVDVVAFRTGRRHRPRIAERQLGQVDTRATHQGRAGN